MAAPSDFYELLGVEESASPQEIRSAYRKFQRVCHPDIAGNTPFIEGSTPESAAFFPSLVFKLCSAVSEAKLRVPPPSGEAATDLSAILNRAYDILSDENTRRAYQDAVKSFRLAGKYDGRPISRQAATSRSSFL